MWSPDNKLVHFIEHPHDENRLLFFSFDYTHILKNIRNLQADRQFDICGYPVSFDLLRRVQVIQKNYPFFRPYRNLTDKHMNPNTLDRMKVRFAYDVYSDEIIATFELFKTYGAEGFTNEGQHIRKRLAVKKHFTKGDDPRLRYLEETLQNYLEKWKDHTVKTRNSQGFLSKETYEALIFTCKSTAACVRYLLQERKFKFVLTRRFSTDNIERMFGAIRSMCGGNNKWDFTKSFGLTFATVPLRATYQ
ncbi:hypothetical protein DAPPUDRAFT_334277 [Daphnia pulex]|uniref:Transposable element P transposase-like RNase H C-terminal domain-containing protein n=1 Tax=Daphnia pulex TaxID=6669 RepID=E9HV64_DAPPU|nr:hypothetical protein DAPPUDRAFT_334277 [Daphnia pulex]|eukprot:EFX64368.1 hypothetical protein DAPPUDRAFT_334277 [Daphnia pulex]